MPEPKKSIREFPARGQAAQAAADHTIDTAKVKATYGTAANARLDAKVKRWRNKKQSRVEDWKERLALRVLSATPDQHHEDVIDAMLELVIDIKIAQLGDEAATEMINLAIIQRINALRGTNN
jgi:hypothetical protein